MINPGNVLRILKMYSQANLSSVPGGVSATVKTTMEKKMKGTTYTRILLILKDQPVVGISC